MKLIYVCSGDVSVYESQVLTLLDQMVEMGVTVLLLQGYMTKREQSNLVQKLSGHCITTKWYKSYPLYPFFERQQTEALYKALHSIVNEKDCVIHVRSESTGFFVNKALERICRIPVLIDIRGIVLEELSYKISQIGGARKWLFKLQQYYLRRIYKRLFVIKDKIALTAVSPLINDYISENYPLCSFPRFFNPNIAGRQFVFSEQEREYIRKKYGFKKDDIIAICSTAGNAVWQKDYQVIAHLVKLGIKIINLSRQAFGNSNVVSTTVPFRDMPAMLSAADIAILWRDDTFMNQSASPSKFSEFAAMGLYVIHNKSVVVATNYIITTESGLLVNDVSEILDLPSANELHACRMRWCKSAEEVFGVEQVCDSYIGIYKSLLG